MECYVYHSIYKPSPDPLHITWPWVSLVHSRYQHAWRHCCDHFGVVLKIRMKKIKHKLWWKRSNANHACLIENISMGLSINTCGGGGSWYTWKLITKLFQPSPLSDLKKIQGIPFLPWKLWVKPTENHVTQFSLENFVVFFSRSHLTRVQHFKGTPFVSDPSNKCLWMVPKCKQKVKFNLSSKNNTRT